MVWDGIQEYNLDELLGVTFRWRYGHFEAVTEEETVTLDTGMPMWNIYSCDLTGDGNPELCSTLSFGSGLIDNRIIIYDYAHGASYGLSDRGNGVILTTSLICKRIPLLLRSVFICKINWLNKENWYFWMIEFR